MKRPLYEHKCVDFMLSVVNSDSQIEHKHIAAKCLPHILTNGLCFSSSQISQTKKWGLMLVPFSCR